MNTPPTWDALYESIIDWIDTCGQLKPRIYEGEWPYISPTDENEKAQRDQEVVDQGFETAPRAVPSRLTRVQNQVRHSPVDEAISKEFSDCLEIWGNFPYPNHPSNKELISESMSLKKGMISAIMNAIIHVTAIIAAQLLHPTTVLECKCLEFRKSRKKMNRAETD